MPIPVPSTENEVIWFSSLFGVDLPQYELPFVDFSISSDVPLYIDPYAITKDPSELAIKCHNTILSFFEILLQAIRGGDRATLRNLLGGHLAEPDQVCLGVSKTPGGGRGIGSEQERLIIDAMQASTAAKTGRIETLQEMELHIRQIGPDKISDLIANIILGLLAEFTEAICPQYGIATRPCGVNGFWSPALREWDTGYFNLPAHGSRSYILVPKRFVRRPKDLMNHRQFYEKYILDTLKRELLEADDSLVRTLQSGRKTITKEDIRSDPRFGLSKDFIAQFIVRHPEAIQKYREDMITRFKPVDPSLMAVKLSQNDNGIEEALLRLDTIQTGIVYAGEYQKIVRQLSEFIFDQVLVNFASEYNMDSGRGRIDIIADNCANGGFFYDARQQYQATSVPMECKNYSGDLGNDEFNQMADRLGPKSTRLGIVFCRKVKDKKSVGKHLADRWLRQDKMMLLIDDPVLKYLTQLRLAGNYESIEKELKLIERSVRFANS